MPTQYKLGKKPPTRDDRDLKFHKYLNTPFWRSAPKGFGHGKMVENPWGMLKNDELGDCEIARQLHATMLANAVGGKQVSFTDGEAVRVYSAVTGYDPNDPWTDQGTVMRDCLVYARNNGVKDANGVTHKIGAFLSVDAKDTFTLLHALYLCDQVAIGFEFPASAMTQFNAGKPWTIVPNSPIEGGHAVEVIGRPSAESVTAVTWGAEQRLTFGFYRTYNDETWAVISEEALNGGRTLEGFDLDTLRADLARL